MTAACCPPLNYYCYPLERHTLAHWLTHSLTTSKQSTNALRRNTKKKKKIKTEKRDETTQRGEIALVNEDIDGRCRVRIVLHYGAMKLYFSCFTNTRTHKILFRSFARDDFIFSLFFELKIELPTNSRQRRPRRYFAWILFDFSFHWIGRRNV